MKKLYALLLVLFMVCSLSLSACDISITNKAEKSGSDAPAISGQSATDEGENSAVTSTSTSDEQSTSGQSGPGGGNAAGADGDDFGHPPAHVYVDGVCVYCGKKEQVDGQGFTFERTMTGYAVTKAPTDAQTVTIPSTYNDLPVTSIYNHAFEGHAMSAVVIPDSVTTIGTYAFSGCENLTSVVIPDSVDTILNFAFYNCTSLKSVTLGGGVSSIAGAAFKNCTSLEDIVIPENVTSIASSVFDGCPCLEYDQSQSLCYVGKWLVGCDDKEVTKVEIREDTTGVAGYTFRECFNLTEAVFPDKVRHIGEYVFYKCSALKSVTLGKNVEDVAKYAFMYCEALDTITLNENLKSIGVFAFYHCDKLSRVNYDGEISRYLNISFGNEFGSDRADPLYYGAKLYNNKDGEYKLVTEIVFPKSVTEINCNLFSKLDQLESVYYEGSIEDWCKINFADIYANPLRVAENLYYTDDGGYKLADDIVISGDVTEIGAHAFNFYMGLKSVTVTAPLEKVGTFAFYGCENLLSVNIPSSLTTISDNAFYYCRALTTFTSFKNVKSIGEWAFYGCNNMSGDVDLTNLVELGQSAFYNCYKISSVTLGEAVTVIPYCAFKACFGMKSITILGKVTKIDGDAFNGCKNILNFTIPDSVTVLESNALSGCEKVASIIVPDSVTKICGAAFVHCKALKSIVIGSGVTSIESYCFTGCAALESIFYHGTEAEWNNIRIDEKNDELNGITKYFYSEEAPTAEGNFWHYVDGVPTAW